MKLLEIFKGKQNQAQTPNTGGGQEGIVNIDKVHQEAGEKLINVTAENTGQRPEQVNPAINQAPKLEQHKSGIPQLPDMPTSPPKLKTQTSETPITEGPKIIAPFKAVRAFVGEEVKHTTLQVTGGEDYTVGTHVNSANTGLQPFQQRHLKKVS